jgi:hypothetical protein
VNFCGYSFSTNVAKVSFLSDQIETWIMQSSGSRNLQYYLLLSLSLFLLLLALDLKQTLSSSTPTSVSQEAGTKRPMGFQIAVHAEGRGNPWINLRDGRDLSTFYTADSEQGKAEGFKQILERNQASPLSLASGDFDGDGVADLVSGYGSPRGGILALYRGNIDSIFPNNPQAQRRRTGGESTDSPFLPEARILELSETPDLLRAGDFNADGHCDIVAAGIGSSLLYLMAGDGKGGLQLAKTVPLSGGVTALAAGEMNRADGLTDLAVGVDGPGGSKVLIFEGPEGALRSEPEIFEVRARVSGFALGQLDRDYPFDLAVAAGYELLILHGRDRKLSFDEIRRAEVPRPSVTRRSFSSPIRSIAAGDFSGDGRTALALLSEDGMLRILGRARDVGRKGRERSEWEEASSIELNDLGRPKGGRSLNSLVTARVSSRAGECLVVVDSGSNRLQIMEGLEQETRSGNKQRVLSNLTRLDVEGSPVAVLPMRLGPSALTDIVMLSDSHTSPLVAAVSPIATLTVTNINDSGPGSLRQAILDANSSPGLDAIEFKIESGVQTIKLLTALPKITDPVIIDGTTQPGFAGSPVIELNPAGIDGIGLNIAAGNCVVRGLAFNRFSLDIWLQTQGGNVVEGNFIGIGIDGTTVKDNQFRRAIVIDRIPNNLIGGTTAAARNVISGKSRLPLPIIIWYREI